MMYLAAHYNACIFVTHQYIFLNPMLLTAMTYTDDAFILRYIEILKNTFLN